ncbi:uncharacterized protein HMPREF1541_03247 [Cyphellophora europaea CBS 101466]|uniref:Oxidation resistance protein 1 n=1 Tax=Cyphellophora europaea (strain CBS 101466) TaxID=1220924 RepID=W2RXZ1_CYPE1|nr:uncharacterized protein HMPREF1541_03247 [Cyphellophora europaea CBS 101466]ETN41312.1 hypothetical protein HMPREF1541_03247 [Cyphellophora europaea CBS 101466]
MESTSQPGRKPSGQGEKAQDSGEATLMSNPYNPNSAAYLAYPVKHVMSSLYRRMTEPPENPVHKLLDAPTPSRNTVGWTPPRRSASPFQPPPLTPLALQHTLSGSAATSLLLSRSLAEEIRLLLPPRLQLLDHWKLAYSLEVHGSSLRSLYDACERVSLNTQRSGYVLVVRDSSSLGATGSVFGAYLTDAPKPAQHYYGTGECFLWRASILPSLRNLAVSANMNGTDTSEPLSPDLLQLAGLPPPPSADTDHLARTTTVRGEKRKSQSTPNPSASQPTSKSSTNTSAANRLAPPPPPSGTASGASTPDRIRFKAFPYSGVNDFMIYCEAGMLSVGGGDGHYGLWLDDTLDHGISETCPTFGNEELSEEGRKFEVLGVEVWYVGA